MSEDAVPSSWRARITVTNDGAELVGERNVAIGGADCSVLDDAVILVVATLIGIADERRARTRAAIERKLVLKAKAAAPVPRVAAVAENVAPEPAENSFEIVEHQSDLQLRIGASARGQIGLLPGFAAGGSITLDVDAPSWGFGVGATFLPRASHTFARRVAAHFTGAAGELAVCWNPARPLGAELALCASVEGGVIAVRTSGLERNAWHLTPVLSGLLGPRLRVPVFATLGLILAVDGSVPILAPKFYVRDQNGRPNYYHTVSFGVSAQFGMSWLFSS